MTSSLPTSPPTTRRWQRFTAAVVVLAIAALPLVGTPATASGTSVDTDELVRLVIDRPTAGLVAAIDPDVDVVRLTTEFAVVETPLERENATRTRALEAGAGVVERDVPVYPVFTPTDPGWSAWWGARQMGLDLAWDTTLGSSNVDIAIIDTGVNPVVELSGKLQPGWAIPGASPTVDTNGHGTNAAMVAAGRVNNGTGAAGACPLCRIIPINVFLPGGPSAFMSDVAAGITWATDNGAEIINVSLAGSATTVALNNAVAYAEANNVVIVAAAGNEGILTPQYPASLLSVVGVAATTSSRELTGYSNRGAHILVAAPGTNVVAGSSFGSAVTFSGTSSASPMVAGTIGLLAALEPSLSAADLRYYVRVASPQPAVPLQVAWGALSGRVLVLLAGLGWPPAPFSDVRRPSYYATAVDWGAATDITTGVAPWVFAPNNTVSRAQAFTMLWRYAGEPAPSIPNPFSDVPNTSYYTDAAIWAFETGITTGVGGSDRFEASRQLTRAESVTILWRYAGDPAPSIPNPFIDVPANTYYTDAAIWAFETGITTGVGGSDRFEPTRTVTRAENLTFLWRFAGSPTGP